MGIQDNRQEKPNGRNEGVLYDDKKRYRKPLDMKKQQELFDTSEFTNWEKEWQGMPEFVSENKKPYQQIIVSFRNFEDVKEFADKLGIKVTPKTNSTWFPLRKMDKGFFYENENFKKDEK